MGDSKKSIIKILDKVCKKHFSEVDVKHMECVETFKFGETGSWEENGFTIFLGVKLNGENRNYMETTLESILGYEVIVSQI